MAWHDESTAPDSIHQIDFVGSTDPALDANNHVTAHKRWLDTSTTPYTQKVRNSGNTDWVTLAGPATYLYLATTRTANTVLAGPASGAAAAPAFRALVAADLPDVGVTTQSGTSYTLALTDRNSLVRCNNAGAITVTVPTNAAVAFPVGAKVAISQAGAGQVTIAGDTGVTVNTSASGTLKTAEQYAVVELLKVATDTWLLYGDREAAP